jgi:hypothetical protein
VCPVDGRRKQQKQEEEEEEEKRSLGGTNALHALVQS